MGVNVAWKLVTKSVSVCGLLCMLVLGNSVANGAELAWVGYDLNGRPCNGLKMKYGPFDYTNALHRSEKLPIVEEYHFTQEIEANAGINIRMIGDLAYTLRAFPNHHRALYAIVRHQLRFDEEIYKRHLTNKNYTPAECYFEKALVFAPKDIKVYQLYAYYLGKKGHHDAAIKQYQRALTVKPKGQLHYQLAKVFFKTKRYDEAVKHAKLAIEQGYKKQDLKDKLKSMGKWAA